MALSKPSRPARTAPVVRVYSSIRPGLTATPVSQCMSCSGQATKPSSDIVKCQSTFAAAVCGSVSSILASCILLAICNRQVRH